MSPRRIEINHQELYEAISYTPTAALEELAEACLREREAEVTEAPRPALVMARASETVDGEVFNLGEVLVTSCEVSLGDESGWAMVPEHDPHRALCAAVLDAAGRHPDATALRDDLGEWLASARDSRQRRWSTAQTTRVEFEEMT